MPGAGQPPVSSPGDDVPVLLSDVFSDLFSRVFSDVVLDLVLDAVSVSPGVVLSVGSAVGLVGGWVLGGWVLGGWVLGGWVLGGWVVVGVDRGVDVRVVVSAVREAGGSLLDVAGSSIAGERSVVEVRPAWAAAADTAPALVAGGDE